MTQQIEVLEYTLPDYLAGYLINGDLDGITAEEKNEIDQYLEDQGVAILSMEDNSSFRWSNDLNRTGGMCSTYFAHKINN